MPEGLADGTALVVRAGAPTSEELVAVLAALDAAARADAAARRPAESPAWSAAARRESVGAARVATRWDLGRWA